MEYSEHYRNFKIIITEKNYKKVVDWFIDVDPGAFIDFCISNAESGENKFYLWNQVGNCLKLK